MLLMLLPLSLIKHFVFHVDIIDDVVNSVDICTNLFFDFYDFDLGSFDYTCNDFDEYVVVCSICAEISSTIHSDCDVGVVYDPPSHAFHHLAAFLGDETTT